MRHNLSKTPVDDLSLIQAVAAKLCRSYGVQPRELWADGYLGLIAARRTYQPSRTEWKDHAAAKINFAIRDGRRKDSRNFLPPVDVDEESISTNHNVTQRIEDIDYLRKHCRNLTERQKQVLVCTYVKGLSMRQTADVIGQSIGTVSTIHSRAMESIRESISFSRASKKRLRG